MCNRLIGSATLVVCVLWGLSGTAGDKKPPKQTDEEIVKLLVGKWSAEGTNDKGVKYKGTNHYKKDGTVTAQGTIEIADKSIEILVSGTWKVDKGVLIETVEKSEPPILKKGQVSKDLVLSIDDKVLKLKTEKGTEIIRKRVLD